MPLQPPEAHSKREHLWRIIFLSDTRAGRTFDIVLLWAIALSILTIMLESVGELRAAHRLLFMSLEWF
ncbi:MAG TPA: hypothetical protein VD994_19305, partial [Prosthecobacter sp.]|nr:hypothetical protein [Prosthecobacter sp.]